MSHIIELPDSWVVPAETAQAPLLEAEAEAADWAFSSAAAAELASSGEDAELSIEAADAHLVAEFERIAELLDVAPFPLKVRRRVEARMGFVSGLICVAQGKRRMLLTLGPNSDLAEQYATLVHEFAHIAHPDHSLDFKEWLVDIAEAAYGQEYFLEARNVVEQKYSHVDLWIAVAIRAALEGKRQIPQAKSLADETHTAKIVSRIQKLQRLAARHPGSVEARTATGRANSMIATYGLADYRTVMPNADLDDEMCDIWFTIEPRQPWQRRVAHEVAEFCGCFSLAHTGNHRAMMHLFGRHADLQFAKYLSEVTLDSLKRRADIYLKGQLALRGGFGRGERVRRRGAFLDSAAYGVQRKLEGIARERRAALRRVQEAAREQTLDTQATAQTLDTQATALALNDLASAKAFAAAEHDKRSSRWGSPTRRTWTFNRAGMDAGQNITVNKGVGSKTQLALEGEGI